MNLAPYERETIILTNDEDGCWEIYTCQGKIMTKLKKIGAEPYEVKRNEEGRIYEAKYRLDYKQISFRKIIQLSDEQKEKRREHMRQISKIKSNT